MTIHFLPARLLLRRLGTSLCLALAWSSFAPAAAGVRQLAATPQEERALQINAGGQAVWTGGERNRHLTWEVYFWDGAATRQLSRNIVADERPALNASGHVVWQSGDQIYLWDGATTR